VNDWFYQNLGFTFSEQSSIVGFTELTDPTFQSAFFPINSDVYPDLVTINDYSPRNSFYLSQSVGVYLKSFSSSQENGEIDAMSISVKDFDHDGDFDFYCSATEISGNQLFVNNNGLFQNAAADYGVANYRFCVGSVWLDVNNDTWSDLYVADAETWDTETPPTIYQRDHLYMFDGTTFNSVDYLPAEGNEFNTYCVAKGDFNNDGFYDLVLGTSLQQGVQVLMNNADATENSWIKVELEGTVSNRDGIGSQIEYFINGNRFIEYTMCGDNYMSQDSKTLILPLGTAQTVDSLIIKWPSGILDKYYNLSEHSLFHFVEDNYNLYAQSLNGVLQICEGQSVTLTCNAPSNGSVLWSNGQTTNQITVSTPGPYWVQLIYSDGYSIQSNTLTIGEGIVGAITTSFINPSCYGLNNGEINITIQDGIQNLSVLWNDGFDAFYRPNVSAGIYSAVVTNQQGCQKTYNFEITQPDFLIASIVGDDASCFGNNDGFALVESGFGGTAPYAVWVDQVEYANNLSLDELINFQVDGLAAGNFSIEIFDANLCSYSDLVEITQPLELTASSSIVDGTVIIDVTGGTPPYDYLWSDPNATGSTAILPSGDYTCNVSDANECNFDLNINVPVGIEESSLYNLQGYLSDRVYYFNQMVPEMEVFDAQGRIVLTNQNLRYLNLYGLADGVYLIQTKDNAHRAKTIRIVLSGE
jgi:hypothetical protein